MTELIKEIEQLIQEVKEVDQKLSYVNYDEQLFRNHGFLVSILEDKLYELEKYDFDKFVELQEKASNYI